MKKVLLILSVLLFAIHSNGQNFIDIKGEIVNDRNEKLFGVTVFLVAADNEQTIKAAFTDNEGKFEFNQVKVTSFRISIQGMGYNKKISQIFTAGTSSEVILPTILIEEQVEALNEVVVTSQKSFVAQKADRIIVDPNALITNAGLSAFEVLEKAPSVTIGFNNSIAIRGKNGVMVLINNKPTNLTVDDLVSYLKAIPASEIERIEIMNNPPAMYDAAGNAGIINIILKKNSVKGTNGSVNVSYGQGKYERKNTSFNLNYRIEKWNFFTSLNSGQNKSFQDLTITRNYFTPSGDLSSVFTQNSYITPNSKNNSFKIGTDFYATSKTTFGIVWNGFSNPSQRNTSNTATVLDGDSQLVNTISSENPMEVDFKNSSFNLNMNHKLKESGQEIAVNLDNISYDSKVAQNLMNQTFNATNQLVDSSQLVSKLPSDIKIKTANVDYTGIQFKGGKLDLGVKSSFVRTRNVANFEDVVDGVRTPNYDFSNDFAYKENINATYVNYAKEFAKFSIQLGLRLENTNIKGYQAGNPVVADSTFHIKYTNLFPTLYVQYKLDTIQKHVVGLSMGRRINRPNYKDLNPFTYPIDRFTFYGGNPYIKPTFSYNVDVSHTFKNYFTTTLMYSYTNDVISETNEQRGTIYYSRPGNFDTEISYGISVNGVFKIKKWWTLNLYTSYLNAIYKSEVYTEKLNDSNWNWVIMPTNQFVINDTWSAELSGQYQNGLLSGQFFISPVGSVRAGISKKILKDKGVIKLNASDVFYTNQIEGQIRNIANANASWYSLFDSRVVTFTFSYRFSKGENLKVRQTGASQEEQKRVKS
ncbi:outer membrane beta-barrel protein [Flavobacterium sp.]|jgi:hypothetical protein|uniref:outer membrane beta-barrel protein n=1 Tax=Flavobacterium sp. TaxID=239 RepID=UPI0037C0FF23